MMDPQERRKQMARILVGLSQLYGRNMNMGTISFFVDVIDPVLTFEEFSHAAMKWQEKNRAFPMPADLIQLIKPPVEEKDDAQIVVNKIVEAINTLGHTWTQWIPKERYIGGSWESDARARLGELGFHVVKAWGGWSVIHNSLYSAGEETVWRAQLRDFVQTQVRLARAGRLDHLPGIPEPLRVTDRGARSPERIEAMRLIEGLKG